MRPEPPCAQRVTAFEPTTGEKCGLDHCRGLSLRMDLRYHGARAEEPPPRSEKPPPHGALISELDTLRVAGLPDLEARVYLATRGVRTSSTKDRLTTIVVKRLGRKEAAVHEALKLLEHRGLIQQDSRHSQGSGPVSLTVFPVLKKIEEAEITVRHLWKEGKAEIDYEGDRFHLEVLSRAGEGMIVTCGLAGGSPIMRFWCGGHSENRYTSKVHRCCRYMRLWGEFSNPVDQARDSPRDLLQMSPLLYRQAETGGYGRSS